MTRRHTLTGRQITIITRLLDVRLHPTEEQGLFRYEEGWDDERVAAEAEQQNQEKDKPIAHDQVGRFRSNAYGNVKRSPGRGEAKPTNVLKREIEALKAEIARLQQHANSMQGQIGGVASSNADIRERVSKMELHLRHRGGYVPPPGKAVSTPPNGTLV